MKPGISILRRNKSKENRAAARQALFNEISASYAAKSKSDKFHFADPPKRLKRTRRRDVVRELERVAASRQNDPNAAADFSQRQIENVDFTGIEELQKAPDLLTGANFSECNLLGCQFGPEMLPGRTRSNAIAIDDWRAHTALDLSGADFHRSHIFSCNFSGTELSRSDFQSAHIYFSNFDLVSTAGKHSWMRANFDDCRIENSYFRGADIRASFLNALILKTDFSPGDLPPFDVKTADRRLSRLSAPVGLSLRAPRKILVEIAEENRDDFALEGDDLSKKWQALLSSLRELASDDVFVIPLRNLVRTNLSYSIFEDAFLYKCAFRAAQMERFVNFDRALVLKSDFGPAQIEELPWRSAIIAEVVERIAEKIPLEDFQAVIGPFRSLLLQLAERIENEAKIVVNEPAYNNPDGAVVTRMATASFDQLNAGESRFDLSDAQDIQMADGIVSDCFFERSVLRNARLQDSVFQRSSFDKSDLSGSKLDFVHFDGDLTDSSKSIVIERQVERLRARPQKATGDGSAEKAENAVEAPDSAVGVEEDAFGGVEDTDGLFEDDVDSATLRNAFRQHHETNDTMREAYSGAAEYYAKLESDLRDDAVGAEAGVRAAEQGAFESCSFYRANLAKTSAVGASFRACMMENSLFTGGAFGEPGATSSASFDYAFLRGARFDDASLEQVNFGGATLTRMQGLNLARSLSGANFFGSQGLRGTEFSGADLTGVILPTELASFGGVLNSVTELTRQARILFATLMFVCVYTALTLFNIDTDSADTSAQPEVRTSVERSVAPDSADSADIPLPVLADAAGSRQVQAASASAFKLPVVGVEVTESIFYFATPFIILAFYMMFQLKFSRIWLESKWLPYRFPDARLVDRHVFPWIFASLIPNRMKPDSRSRRSSNATRDHVFSEKLIAAFETFLASFLGWFVAPGVLFWLFYRQIQINNGLLIGDSAPQLELGWLNVFATTQVAFWFTVIVTILAMLQVFNLFPARRTAPESNRRPHESNDERDAGVFGKAANVWREIRGRIADGWRRIRSLLTFGAAAAAALAVTVVPANLPEYLRNAAMRDNAALSPPALQIVDAVGRMFYVSSAETVISDSNVTLSKRNIAFLHGAQENLSAVDFSSSQLVRPHLQGATISAADFSDATIVYGNFDDADLSGASFEGTRILSSSFINAKGATAETFKGACVNRTTVLPAGVGELPICTPENLSP